MIELILLSLVGGLFSLAGGALLLWRPAFSQRLLTPLLAFGGGAFLGAAFLDMLPEAVEMVEEPHPIMLTTLAGFMAFFVLERLIMKYFRQHEHHEHSDHTESLSFLIILGDSFHNFLDGILIALTWLVDPMLGLPTALAIAAHELPQEIGDFAVLLKLGWHKKTILLVNIFQSLLTIPGVLVGFYVGQSIEEYMPYLLAIGAGIFLYIAATDIIPEVHHRAGHRQFFSVIVPAFSAMGMIFYLSQIAHR